MFQGKWYFQNLNEERKEIIESAIDDVKKHIFQNIDAWDVITKSSDTDNFKFNLRLSIPDPTLYGNALFVLDAFKEFCKEPTDPESKDQLMKDIVGLVGSSSETGESLEEYVEEKFRNSAFWTSLLAALRERYVRELKEKIGSKSAGAYKKIRNDITIDLNILFDFFISIIS